MMNAENSGNSHNSAVADYRALRWELYFRKIRDLSQSVSPQAQASLKEKPVFLQRNVRSSMKFAQKNYLSPLIWRSNFITEEELYPIKPHFSSEHQFKVHPSTTYFVNSASLEKGHREQNGVTAKKTIKFHAWHAGWAGRNLEPVEPNEINMEPILEELAEKSEEPEAKKARLDKA